uniref:Transmembrane protein 119b n=1 Tax=Oncorhynchus mykiss TaxID=8022 RepID=A0A8C7SDG6_ONCMY
MKRSCLNKCPKYLSVMLWSSSPSLATPLPFNISLEGSAEGEELGSLIPTPYSPTTSGPASESPTTSDGSTHIEHFLLSQMVHFLQENMLLILVASILFITIFLILCCACIMSRKRKVNAYYPSSFPSKMYNLRTPSKPPLGEREGNNPTQIAAAAEKSPDVNVQAEGEIIEKDNEPSNAPEQSEESNVVCICTMAKVMVLPFISLFHSLVEIIF